MSKVIVECRLIEDCIAQKRTRSGVQKKPFRIGTKVIGIVENVAITPDHQLLALKTKEGYIIPESFLNVIGAVGKTNSKPVKDAYYEEIQEAEIVDDENDSRQKGKILIKNGGKISDLVAKSSKQSKSTVNFALYGTGIAVVAALLMQKNKFAFGVMGALIGGMIGNYYGKLTENENEKTNK